MSNTDFMALALTDYEKQGKMQKLDIKLLSQ